MTILAAGEGSLSEHRIQLVKKKKEKQNKASEQQQKDLVFSVRVVPKIRWFLKYGSGLSPGGEANINPNAWMVERWDGEKKLLIVNVNSALIVNN